MYIKRERYLEKIRPFYEADLIKVLTGVRRCGKSVLIEQIEEELRNNGYDDDHIIKINFENLNEEQVDRKTIYRYLDKMEKACLIDRVKRFNIVDKKPRVGTV